LNPLFIQCLGWSATAVFVGSYFFARPSLLRAAQMLGALLWITYGVLINASPVIVANVLVFAAAAWTTFRTARESSLSETESAQKSRVPRRLS
jgi:hypothetical protein